jgi:hypothetical protein
MRLLAVGLLLATVLAFSAHAQQKAVSPDSIEFEGIRLHLGMTVEQVRTLLAKDGGLKLTTTPREDGAILGVLERKRDDKALGSVGFRDDKAFSIKKVWDIYENPPRVLFYLLQQFSDEGRTHCSLEAVNKDDATAQFQQARIICGTKTILVYWFEMHEKKGTTAAGVSEVLGDSFF